MPTASDDDGIVVEGLSNDLGTPIVGHLFGSVERQIDTQRRGVGREQIDPLTVSAG
jgi:hypothetical protein